MAGLHALRQGREIVFLCLTGAGPGEAIGVDRGDRNSAGGTRRDVDAVSDVDKGKDWLYSPEQDHVRLSVVSTGTATVSTGMLGRYLATSRAVEPPRVSTTIRLACT